jgi:hypothetical protein
VLYFLLPSTAAASRRGRKEPRVQGMIHRIHWYVTRAAIYRKLSLLPGQKQRITGAFVGDERHEAESRQTSGGRVGQY